MPSTRIRRCLPLNREKVIVLMLAALVFVVAFTIARSRFSAPKYSARNDLLFGMANLEANSPFRSYTVSLTAGVTPKRMHSHNDYEQSVPLLKALSYGAASVEADIWLVDGQLLVGHTEGELRPDRTLASLYLDPLMSLIEQANQRRGPMETKPRGVFETAPDLPLQLLIDLKTEGESTFTALYDALSPLRSQGYLTTWTNASSSSPNSSLSSSLITVVGTGNTPPTSVSALGHSSATPRDIFLDGPLTSLSSSPQDLYAPSLSPLASTNFGEAIGALWMLPWIGRARIRALVEEAHKRGIQARFWNAPNAPPWARNTVWQMLMDEGADWLNVDDLPAAHAF